MARFVVSTFLVVIQIGIIKCGYSENFLFNHKNDFAGGTEAKLSGWDVGFDCKIKKLAFDYAKKLSPGTGSDFELDLIFKGLELGAICNETFHQQNFEYPWSKLVNKEINTDTTAVVFVDRSSGENHFQGTIIRPLSDIQSGVDLCFSKIQALENNVKSCIVNVRQGTYELEQPLKMYSNIKLTNYKDEKVVVSGFRTVKPAWTQVAARTDQYENLNPIFETIAPMKSSNKVKYLGKTTTSLQCETNCDKLKNCSSYVYFDKSNKDFGNQCYGRVDGVWNPVITNGAVSGKKVYTYNKGFVDIFSKKIISQIIS